MDADGDICQHEHTNSKKRPTIWTHLAAHPHEAHKQHGHRKHDRQAGSKTNLFEKTVADFWAPLYWALYARPQNRSRLWDALFPNPTTRICLGENVGPYFALVCELALPGMSLSSSRSSTGNFRNLSSRRRRQRCSHCLAPRCVRGAPTPMRYFATRATSRVSAGTGLMPFDTF